MMNVVLVDDEPWVIEGLRTMVNWEKYGFQVCGDAQSGPDAIKLIQDLKPDLVLTDINMPVLSGLELIEQTNRMMKAPPKFVILSGYDDFQYAITAMRHRVTEYLLKPIDEEEIESILVRIGQKIQDEQAAARRQAHNQSLYTNNLLNRLIQGEYNETLELQAARSMELQETQELQCVLIEADSNPTELRRQVITCFPQDVDRSFQDSTGRTGMIVPTASFTATRLEEIGVQLYKDLADSLGRPVIVTVSGSLKGIGSIREMYLQALELLQCKQSQGKEGVFFYYKDFNKTKKPRDYYKEKFRQLYDIVLEEDAGRIAMAVEDSFTSISSGLLDLEAVKALIADMELTLCRRIAEMNGDPDSFMKSIQDEHGCLSDMGNYPAIKKYVHGLCLKAGSLLAKLRLHNENNTIFHVIQYVDREFHNKLQLQDLARHFHMNSTYLGQVFKKETGKSFNEYLNEKRIEEAKRLLKRTQMKISDVALQVGYPNTDYFISKFKSKTGILPSVYKHEVD